MIFQSKIHAQPRAHDAALGAETAALYEKLGPEAQALIAGIAGCSPYLRGLLETERDWLCSVVHEPADTVLAALPEKCDAPETGLRRAKRRAALVLALLDLGGIWDVTAVTNALSGFADRAVDLALRHALANARGIPVHKGTAPLLSVIAMGKWGAGELNYSSDIDLIVLFDDRRFARDDLALARAALIKATRKCLRMLSDRTDQGYVFRTDIRLRPNPSVTPICVPFGQALRYYETEARTWERAAFIKARVAAGDAALGAGFLKALRPFIWRSGLDFTTIAEVQDLLVKIREHKGVTGPITVPGHDLKLGRGGIREIEFLAQTRQLIAGGRDPDLRMTGTVQALRELAVKGWVDAENAERLEAAYYWLRRTEHRVQMLQDAQTHTVPNGDEAIDRLAAFCGYTSRTNFEDAALDHLSAVHEITGAFFEPPAPVAPADAESDAQSEKFEAWAMLPAFRHARVQDIFYRLRPTLSGYISASQNETVLLAHLDRFFSRLRAGLKLFSLFEARPDILRLVVDFAALSPRLAEQLAEQVQVLDGLAFDSFFAALPDIDTYHEMLTHHLRGISDYEDGLIATRHWRAEQHFQIVVQALRGLPPEQVTRAFSDLAEAVLVQVVAIVQRDFERQHGRIEGSALAILAMGKLGSREMTSTSDLDLIVVFDGPDAASDGARPLDAAIYFSRLTKKLINALSAPMPGGVLYEIDMRLRPSGRKGPVATKAASFESYQRNEAWVWEHLALTRARVVAGDRSLVAALSAMRMDLLTVSYGRERIVTEIAEMRARLASAEDATDIKKGRGGLLEIELVAQACVLLSPNEARAPAEQLRLGASECVISEAVAAPLIAAHRVLSRVEQLRRLLYLELGETTAQGHTLWDLFESALGVGDAAALDALIRENMSKANVAVEQFLRKT